MDYSIIEDIVKKRVQNMHEINEKEIDKIIQCSIKILEFCKINSIEFDETAGIVFVSHITTFYERAKKKEYIKVDCELFAELGEELYKMGEKIIEIMNEYFNCVVPKDEILLIASHLGAMKERLNKEEC